MQRPGNLWAILLLFVLAACSSGQPAPAAVGTAKPAPAVAPVNLFLWHGWSSEQAQALAQLVDAYNSSQSAVRIVPQRVAVATLADDIDSASRAGGGPHLMLIPNRWVGRLAGGGVLLPLDDYVSSGEQRLLLPTALAGARSLGADKRSKLYGVPVAVDTVALYYNRSNFPEPPPDTETMLTTAAALSDAAAIPRRWGLAYNLSLDATIGYLYAFGGRVFDEQGKLVLGAAGRAGVEKWLDWQLKLSRNPQVHALPDGVQVSRDVAANQVLMTVDWSHNIANYRRLWGDQLGVTSLPPLSSGATPTPYVLGEVAAINVRASAAEHQAALNFVRFMLRPQSQQLLWQVGRVPVLQDITTPAEGWVQPEALQAFHTQARQGIPALNDPLAPVVERVLRQMQRDVLRGLASPADAVTQANAALEGLVSTAGEATP